MRLRRVEIRNFRKIEHLVIEGLADGLNVLVGDNEAGKSTVLAALRAALFERHRLTGKGVRAMLPHNQEVRPEITIDFDVGAAAYRLRKAFHQRPEAELTGSAMGRITGDEVEERLADLLGFQASGSTISKPREHQGVYGLLWVDQGLAHSPLDSGGGQSSLANALESEVGQVLGGERGRHLIAAAEKRRDDFWNKVDTPKPKGAFREAQETVKRLELERADLELRLRGHDDKVTALAGKIDILQRHARDDRLAGAARSADQARQALARAASLRENLEDLSRARHHAATDRDTAAGRVEARRTLIAQAEAARSRTVLTRSQAEAERTTLALAARAVSQADDGLAAARQAREKTEADLAELERGLARAKARRDLARAANGLAEAETVALKRQHAIAAAAAIRLTKADLAAVDKLCAERDQARAKRDVASVEITFHPDPGAAASIDGVAQAAETVVRLARDATIDLGGFGRLAIRPGGGVVALARAVEESERRLDERLRGLGHASRNDLANALARKAEAEGEAAAQERVFAVLAPQGLDVLRAERGALEAVAGPGEADPSPPVTEEDRSALRRLHGDRIAAEKAAAAAAREVDRVREEAARKTAVLAERLHAGQDAEDAALSALGAARLALDDARLDTLLAEVEDGLARALEAEAAARVALDVADPETAALALKRAEAAERAIRQDIETLTLDKVVLETELRTLGAEGFGELLDETEGQLTLHRRRLASLEREAEASLLLHRTLATAQRESKDRWLGPVRERVRPYLRLIQPDSEIVLNEKTFSIEHLVRGGVSEPFETLSVGAREQVAVITRLALADILRASGQPSAIILDDALVNTDETRLERMHLVLHKAAQTLQVIVLTCRERDFLALGAPIHRL